jgi:hypothetical protein
MDIEKVVALVILTNIGWFIVGWSVGLKKALKMALIVAAQLVCELHLAQLKRSLKTRK